MLSQVLSLPLPVAQGGTGSTTAAAARTALGLGAASVLGVGAGLAAAGGNVIRADVGAANAIANTSATATVDVWNVVTSTSAESRVTLPALAAGAEVRVRVAPSSTKTTFLQVGSDLASRSGTVSRTYQTGISPALPGIGVPGTGTISTGGASTTTVTGTGTSWLTEGRLKPGDVIRTSGGPRRVTAIASDTSLTVDAAVTIWGPNAYVYDQVGVEGGGTSFTAHYAAGDAIVIGGVVRRVTWRGSDTALAVECPFHASFSGQAHSSTQTKVDGTYFTTLFAGDAATLLCDGTAWVVLSRKTSSLKCRTYKGSDVAANAIAAATNYAMTLDAVFLDSSGLMADTGGSTIVCRRAGSYSVTGLVTYISIYRNTNTQTRIHPNGDPWSAVDFSVVGQAAAATADQITGVAAPPALAPLAYGDVLKLYAYHNSSRSEPGAGASMPWGTAAQPNHWLSAKEEL